MKTDTFVLKTDYGYITQKTDGPYGTSNSLGEALIFTETTFKEKQKEIQRYLGFLRDAVRRQTNEDPGEIVVERLFVVRPVLLSQDVRAVFDLANYVHYDRLSDDDHEDDELLYAEEETVLLHLYEACSEDEKKELSERHQDIIDLP